MKELKLEGMRICNDNYDRLRAQQKAAEYLASNKEKRRQKSITLFLTLFTIYICTIAFLLLHNDVKANDAVTEQTYIARYGTTYDYGETIITNDGNIWTLIDAPEYEDGTEVRVLFDSRNTPSPLDDVIIDVTEKDVVE